MSFNSDDHRKAYFANRDSAAGSGRSSGSGAGVGSVVGALGSLLVGSLRDAFTRHESYLANPPAVSQADYVQHVTAMRDWAARQDSRLTEALKSVSEDDYDRLDEISDLRYAARRVVSDADEKLSIESERTARGYEG